MSISAVSNSSIQQTLTSRLQAEQAALTTLTTQLSTSQLHSNLTDYAPTDALNLMNLQSSAAQGQSYLNVIGTVQTRLSGYDATMTDMESIIAQAQTLANGSNNYDPNKTASIATQATNFLKSVSVDLNQQIGGRYIYAGARYDTAPVTDLTTLSGAPDGSIYTDGSTLPSYDAANTGSALTMAIAGQTVTVGGTVATPESASVTVNGKTYSYSVQSGDTTTAIATGLAALVNADIPGTTSAGAVVTIGGSNAPTAAVANPTSATAYATDSATVGSGFSLPYGVSSDNPAFQTMIAGLRFLQAAGQSTDQATYKANITQASALLSTALNSVEAVHTSVAGNINTLTTEKNTQTSLISSLTDQVDNIQQVDITQVSAELTALETQLQASYSATGSLEKMSIVQYL